MAQIALLSRILLICIIPTTFAHANSPLAQADSLDKARKHLAFGGRNLKAKQYDRAKEQLDKAWAYFPTQKKSKRAQCARLLGRYYQEVEQFEDAVFWYEKAIAITPTNTYNKKAYSALAHIHTHQQHPQKAIKAYEALLAYPTETQTKIGYLYHITVLYIEQENYDHALQAAKKWSALAPEDPRVKELLSKLHMQTGGQDEAIAQMEQIVQMNPDDTNTLTKLAEHYTLRNNTQKAFDTYSHLHQKEPENFLFLEQLYKLGHQLQKPKADQISTLQKMHKLQPQNVWIVESIADLTEDIAWINKGLRLDPQNGRLLYLMGNHHYTKWQTSNAPDDSLQALKWYTKTVANIQWKDQAQQMLDIINPPMTARDSLLHGFWNDPKNKRDTARVAGKK